MRQVNVLWTWGSSLLTFSSVLMASMIFFREDLSAAILHFPFNFKLRLSFVKLKSLPLNLKCLIFIAIVTRLSFLLQLASSCRRQYRLRLLFPRWEWLQLLSAKWINWKIHLNDFFLIIKVKVMLCPLESLFNLIIDVSIVQKLIVNISKQSRDKR